jgi:excisionase family DNA binding protein
MEGHRPMSQAPVTEAAAPEIRGPRAALRIRQVAAQLNISETKTWSLIARGEIESFKIDGQRRVLVSAVDDYIARQQAADAEARRGGSAA